MENNKMPVYFELRENFRCNFKESSLRHVKEESSHFEPRPQSQKEREEIFSQLSCIPKNKEWDDDDVSNKKLDFYDDRIDDITWFTENFLPDDTDEQVSANLIK